MDRRFITVLEMNVGRRRSIQVILDIALILAVLESIFGTCVVLTRKDSILTLGVTFLIALPKSYIGISKLVYFSHFYTLGITAGVLSNSILRNIRIGFAGPSCYILFIWVCAQLASSSTNKSWWFVVGIAKLLVQMFCLSFWYCLLGYQRRQLYAR